MRLGVVLERAEAGLVDLGIGVRGVDLEILLLAENLLLRRYARVLSIFDDREQHDRLFGRLFSDHLKGLVVLVKFELGGRQRALAGLPVLLRDR